VSPLQPPGESDSVKELTISSLVSLRDELFPAAEVDKSENQAFPSKFTG
jgi:hypothetical protein